MRQYRDRVERTCRNPAISPGWSGLTFLGVTPLRYTANPLGIPLPFTSAHVVPNGIACNIAHRLVLGDVFGIFSNYHHQLCLVVCFSLLCALWNYYTLVIIGQSGDWFNEQLGEWWCRPSPFLYYRSIWVDLAKLTVFLVIQSNAFDVGT